MDAERLAFGSAPVACLQLTCVLAPGADRVLCWIVSLRGIFYSKFQLYFVCVDESFSSPAMVT